MIADQHVLPWWRDPAQYVDPKPLPAPFDASEPDVVRANRDGTTQPGWGAADYLRNRRAFSPLRHNLNRPFGIVMRSLPWLCVDVDPKNGGTTTETERALTALGLDAAPTLAERSRSGAGYHLFYAVADEWDTDPDNGGFHRYADRIGLLPGVDIKAVTLVFHHPHQRWNQLPVVGAPAPLLDVLSIRQSASRPVPRPDSPEARRAALWSLRRLREPIVDGERNGTLWGIAKDLYRVGVIPPSIWESTLIDRATESGLSEDEANGIIRSARQAVDREH